MEKLTPKDFQFSKSDRKILLRYLEKYYITQLKMFQYHMSLPDRNTNKTMIANYDRRFRLRVKPVELVLHSLGSEFMSHVNTASIRKTFELACRQNGTFQSERKTLDYFHRFKRKRVGKIHVPVKTL